jgi:sialate O-acetylesterase
MVTDYWGGIDLKQQITLAPIFSDYMVFQANKPIKVFGTCKKGAEIIITFPHQEVKIKAKDESFLVEISEMKMTKQGFSFSVTSKKEKQTIYNCLVGEVFILTGEANASFSLQESYEPLVQENTMVRYYQEINKYYLTNHNDEFDCKSSWMISNQESARTFSAIGYYVASGLCENLQSPIGIILLAMNDSSIFSWINYEHILANDNLRKVIIDYQVLLDAYPSKADYDSVFEEQVSYYQESHQLSSIPMGPRHHNRPAGLYDTLFSPLVPFPIKAVIVCHGESCGHQTDLYEEGLKTMILAWRSALHDSKLPFYFTQIAGYLYPGEQIDSMAFLRDAQTKCMNASEYVYMTTAIDLGDNDSITPKDKIGISERITNIILEKSFKIGKNTMCPSFFSYQINKNKMVIHTQHNPLNLVSKSMQSLGFFLSYDRIKFFEARDVVLMNNQIIIPDVKNVREVRYGFINSPLLDIYSSNGLPLLPLRIIIDI